MPDSIVLCNTRLRNASVDGANVAGVGDVSAQNTPFTAKRKYRSRGLLNDYSTPDQPGVYVCPRDDCNFTSKYVPTVYSSVMGVVLVR